MSATKSEQSPSLTHSPMSMRGTDRAHKIDRATRIALSPMSYPSTRLKQYEPASRYHIRARLPLIQSQIPTMSLAHESWGSPHTYWGRLLSISVRVA